jgi:hypothetical protein
MALGTTGLVVTAALVAGAAGAGAAVAILESSKPSTAAPAADTERLASLEERVSKQDRELADLRSRLTEAAHGRPHAPPPPEGGMGPGAMPGEAPGGTAEGQVPMPSPGEPPAGGANLSPEDREKFSAYYREMREQEQEKARKQREAAYEAQLRGRIERLPAELALTPEQKDAAVRILVDRAQRMRAVFAEVQPGAGPEARKAMQEKADAIREETRNQLQAALTADQAKAVEQMATREGIGGAGPGNRPGVRRAEPGTQGAGRRRVGAGGTQPEQPPAPTQPPR